MFDVLLMGPCQDPQTVEHTCTCTCTCIRLSAWEARLVLSAIVQRDSCSRGGGASCAQHAACCGAGPRGSGGVALLIALLIADLGFCSLEAGVWASKGKEQTFEIRARESESIYTHILRYSSGRRSGPDSKAAPVLGSALGKAALY